MIMWNNVSSNLKSHNKIKNTCNYCIVSVIICICIFCSRFDASKESRHMCHCNLKTYRSIIYEQVRKHRHEIKASVMNKFSKRIREVELNYNIFAY